MRIPVSGLLSQIFGGKYSFCGERGDDNGMFSLTAETERSEFERALAGRGCLNSDEGDEAKDDEAKDDEASPELGRPGVGE